MPDNKKQLPSNEVKEYADDRGNKIVVSDKDLTSEGLNALNIDRLEQISSLKDLQSKEACHNCRFWNSIDSRQDKKGNVISINGECRFNAPEIYGPLSMLHITHGPLFPEIGPYQWCGKYEAIQ